MNQFKPFCVCALSLGLLADSQPSGFFARQNSNTAEPAAQQTATPRDGQHDFDFELGTWNMHLKRLDHRLVGSTHWIASTAPPSPVKSGMAAPISKNSRSTARLGTLKV